MNIFDLDKNSLPEQVQINKEAIKDIEDNLIPDNLQAAKDYADAQDVIKLQEAKDYADGKDATTLAAAKSYSDGLDIVTNGKFLQVASEAEIYSSSSTYDIGDIVRYNVQSGIMTQPVIYLFRCKVAITTPEAWNSNHWDQVKVVELIDEKRDKDVPIVADDIDSESATNGQVLTADGSGGASWGSAGGGGLKLLWSGSVLLSSTPKDIGTLTFDNTKIYMMVGYQTYSSETASIIVLQTGKGLGIFGNGANYELGQIEINFGTNKVVYTSKGALIGSAQAAITVTYVYEMEVS